MNCRAGQAGTQPSRPAFPFADPQTTKTRAFSEIFAFKNPRILRG